MTITKSVSFSQTPLSNTGSVVPSSSLPENFSPKTFPFEQLSTQQQKSFSSSLDWWQGILKISASQFDFVVGELASTFRDTFDVDKGYFFEGRAFEHHRVSDRGAKIFWNILENGDRDILVMLPAGFLKGALGTYMLRRVIIFFSELNFKPTRLDACIDDYTKTITWQKIHDAYLAGHAHGFKIVDPRHPMLNGQPNGFTYYMGSPSSDKRIYLYDKFVESKGEINSHRLEARLKDGWAQSAWLLLVDAARPCKSDVDFHKCLVNITCSVLDFYEKVGKEKVTLKWWEDWKKMVNAEGVTISSGRVQTTIESTLEWHKDGGVARSLATIKQFCYRSGIDFAHYLDELIKYGATKIRSVHINQVNSAIHFLGIDENLPDYGIEF